MDVDSQYKEYWKNLEREKLDEERKRIEEIPFKLRERIRNAVERNLSDALLLSGLYSGILAYYLKQLNPEIETITVGVENAPDLIDLKNAETIASSLGIKHHEYRVSSEQVSDAIPKVIRILKTSDSNYLSNDLVIYFGLKFAQKRGIRSVMTGEGANELFAGYNYAHTSSNNLGDYFHIGMEATIEIKRPYLNLELNEFVLTNKIEKSTLRNAFADDLPFEIVYRRKFPIEQTSGLAEPLKKFMESQISDRKAWWENTLR